MTKFCNFCITFYRLQRIRLSSTSIMITCAEIIVNTMLISFINKYILRITPTKAREHSLCTTYITLLQILSFVKSLAHSNMKTSLSLFIPHENGAILSLPSQYLSQYLEVFISIGISARALIMRPRNIKRCSIPMG